MRMHEDAGKKVKGTVTRITDFGAFVRLQDGRIGLVHISQVADVYVSDVHDFLRVGQEIEPVLLSVDEKGRLALSLKTVQQKNPAPPRTPTFAKTSSSGDLEDMLSRYKMASEDKLGFLPIDKNIGKRKNR